MDTHITAPHPSYTDREDILFSPPTLLTLTKVFGFTCEGSVSATHNFPQQRKVSVENEIDLLPRVAMRCVIIHIQVSDQRLAQVIHYCCY